MAEAKKKTEKKEEKKERKMRTKEQLLKDYQKTLDRAMETVKKYQAKINRIKKIENKAKYQDASKAVMNLTPEQLEAFNAWMAQQKKGE